jgi:hypothetical protein
MVASLALVGTIFTSGVEASQAAAASVPADTATAKTSAGYIDLTGDFARIYDRDANLPDKQRIEVFIAEFERLIPGFYSAQRVYDGDKSRYDQRLLSAFAKYPSQRAAIGKVSDQFGELIGSAIAGFRKAFPGYRTTVPVYLVNSLGEMDGGTRDLPSGKALIFGADVIARIHSADRLMPLFDHELFHVYQSQTTKLQECDQVWCSLWVEGLAVYVAQRLNPGATDGELLLTFPEPIRPAMDAHRKEAVCTVQGKLDSRDEKDMGAMFSTGRLGPNLPPRFGYYVGYLVARDLGRSRSLETLARLQGPALRRLIARSLGTLASCNLAGISGMQY